MEKYNNSKIIEKIVGEKIPCVFVSPHMDDAVLSAGDLISHLAGKTKVEVINVFTSSSDKPYTLSTRAFLYKCGYSDAKKLFADRIIEDRLALSKLKIRPVNLGFVDAPFRKHKKTSKLRKTMSNLLPESIHIYPVHRWHISDGKISPHDTGLINEIASSLKQAVSKYENCYIFCPIANGTHVDHKIVRRVCELSFKNILFWADYPYNNKAGNDSMKIAFNWLKNTSKKIGLISDYKSQVNLLFPAGKINVVPETYYIKN